MITITTDSGSGGLNIYTVNCNDVLYLSWCFHGLQNYLWDFKDNLYCTVHDTPYAASLKANTTLP